MSDLQEFSSSFAQYSQACIAQAPAWNRVRLGTGFPVMPHINNASSFTVDRIFSISGGGYLDALKHEKR